MYTLKKFFDLIKIKQYFFYKEKVLFILISEEIMSNLTTQLFSLYYLSTVVVMWEEGRAKSKKAKKICTT